MNEALQALEIKVENGGATPQGKFFAKDWNTLVEAVKQLDLAEFDEAALNKYLKDNGYITSDDIPSTDLSDVVTRSGEQTIPGAKNFTGGLMVNGQPIVWNAEKGVWQLTGDLVVTGAISMFSSLSGFVPSTVTDAVLVDNETIIKVKDAQGNWVLRALGGGSGGTGGGLTAAEVNALISNALKPYALSSSIPTDNKQLSNGAGYITAAALSGLATEQYVTTRGYITSDALAGYATETWVEGKKYLTGITSSQVTTALGFTPYNATNPDKYIKGIDYDMVIAALGYTPYSTTNPMGYLTISSLLGYATEQWVGDNYLSKNGGTIEGVLELNSTNAARSIRFNTTFGSSWLFVNSGEWYVTNIGWGAEYKLVHSNNIGSYNAGSATKLQTPRTIWGQSFDGTGDISGLLTNVDGIRGSTTNGGYIGDRNKGLGATDGGSMIYNYSSSPITFHIAGSEYMRITNGGNVAIGGTMADAKLHVYGDILTTGNIEGGIFGLRNSSPDNPLLRLTVGNQNYYVQATSDGIYLGPTSTLSLKVDANGNTTINGNLLTTGAITMFSQLSMKNVIDYDGLSLAQLAQIKPARFTWKDGRDSLVHAGGIADEVMRVLPEVVHRTNDDKLTMDYGSAGFFMSASLIKPVIDHEKRIAELERENAELKRKVEQLRVS